MRRRKGTTRQVLISVFCVVALLTTLIQLWLILQRRQCSQWLEVPAEVGVKRSEPLEASLLDHVWSGVDVTTAACLGPHFSSLTRWNETTQSLQLTTTCPGGFYSFTTSDQSALHFTFPRNETLSLTRQSTEDNSSSPREFIRAICPHTEHFPLPEGKRGWSNYHALHFPNQVAIKRAQMVAEQQGTGEKSWNVLLLVLSGVSERHFQRALPRTTSFLQTLHTSPRDARVFHYDRFHSVATSPLRNQFALFSGLSLPDRDLSDARPYRSWLDSSQPEQQQSAWMWDLYQRRGYVTLFAEEHCVLQQSVRHFFTAQSPLIDDRFTELYCQFASDPFYGDIPTNARPLAFQAPQVDGEEGETESGAGGWQDSSQERVEDGWRRGSSCVGDKFIHSVLLEYVSRFVESYHGRVPFFAPVIFTEGVEPTRTRIKTLDRSLLSFLQALEARGVFKDTVVVLTSDQGYIHPDDLPATMVPPDLDSASWPREVVDEERRHPFLYMMVPTTLGRFYPQAYAALSENQGQMSTVFDLFSTLHHLLYHTIPEQEGPDTNGTASSFTTMTTVSHRSLVPHLLHSVSLFEVSKERTCGEAAIPGDMCRCDRTLISPQYLVPFFLFLGFSSTISLWWAFTWCK